jgi:hypothetical protein
MSSPDAETAGRIEQACIALQSATDAPTRQAAKAYLQAFQSCWLPAQLLRPEQRSRLADALFAATRHWPVELHFNKGLAGAPAAEREAARDTATNPAVLDAFALAICGASGPPAYPGVAGHEPDVPLARANAAAVSRASAALRALVPDAASYVSESDFFEADWQRAYWGANYPRLLAAKDAYDFLGSPEGELAIAQAVVYCATAPKSNAGYAAFGAAMRTAKEAGSLLPPKHILNAPTRLMQDEGYGRGYAYDHDAEEAFSGQNYFPEALERQKFYDPPERGFEREIRKRLEYWAKLRKERGGA